MTTSTKNRYTLWGIKLITLLIISIPSWNYFFINLISNEIFKGLSYGQLIYFLIVTISILILLGRKILSICHSIASIIVLSVVFFGSFISLVEAILTTSPEFVPTKILDYSPHYISLFITMMTVVPLSLAIFSSIPFFQYEKKVLKKMEGMSIIRKIILISVRVFGHIIYNVIPKIILVKREEDSIIKSTDGIAEDIIFKKCEKTRGQLIILIRDYFQIGIVAIRSSIEYIPLWALEISHLPNKKEIRK